MEISRVVQVAFTDYDPSHRIVLFSSSTQVRRQALSFEASTWPVASIPTLPVFFLSSSFFIFLRLPRRSSLAIFTAHHSRRPTSSSSSSVSIFLVLLLPLTLFFFDSLANALLSRSRLPSRSYPEDPKKTFVNGLLCDRLEIFLPLFFHISPRLQGLQLVQRQQATKHRASLLSRYKRATRRKRTLPIRASSSSSSSLSVSEKFTQLPTVTPGRRGRATVQRQPVRAGKPRRMRQVTDVEAVVCVFKPAVSQDNVAFEKEPWPGHALKRRMQTEGHNDKRRVRVGVSGTKKRNSLRCSPSP